MLTPVGTHTGRIERDHPSGRRSGRPGYACRSRRSGSRSGRAGYGRRRLAGQLRALGLPAGCDVLVHCSLRNIGWVDGGAATLLAALRSVLGPESTLVLPAQTAGNSVTSPLFRARTAGMSAAAQAAYEAALPGFDPRGSPVEGMGVLAEYVRRTPRSVRSAHPLTSFVAYGPRAVPLMAGHAVECHLGERSPLAALYRAGAHILLLGVDYAACTALHLAEYRLPWPPPYRSYRCYLAGERGAVRLDFFGPELDDSDFPRLGADLDREPFVRTGPVGRGTARLLPIRLAVDFAIDWMTTHRRPPEGFGKHCESDLLSLA